ncbi:homologous-pairing protein 2 homolog isoform X2 [Culicoides brevitarsis]|uniref:homologous-pairing protein 2 homolog isoform X2 n=1 Tax=Culicoides brevitarsis TaxID=469753 RepID=UPI00307B1F73
MSSLATAETVLQLMKTLNRPCSVNCLIEKDKQLGKSGIQKALDKLVSDKKIMLKEYGKQKIYSLKQETEGDAEVARTELRTLDIDITTTEQKIKQKTAELKNLQSKLKQEPIKKSSSTLRAENSQLLNQIADVTIKIGLKNDRNQGVEVISAEEKKEIKQNYEKYRTAYTKRKKLCKEMIETIAESYPGTKKKLMEELGVETDEDVGFVFDAK